MTMSYEEQDYHRRRSEIELERALSANDQESALAHLTLAQLHRARRQLIASRHGLGVRKSAAIRIDKEA